MERTGCFFLHLDLLSSHTLLVCSNDKHNSTLCTGSGVFRQGVLHRNVHQVIKYHNIVLRVYVIIVPILSTRGIEIPLHAPLLFLASVHRTIARSASCACGRCANKCLWESQALTGSMCPPQRRQRGERGVCLRSRRELPTRRRSATCCSSPPCCPGVCALYRVPR